MLSRQLECQLFIREGQLWWISLGQLSPTHYFLKRNFYDGLYCTAEKCEKDVRLLRACLDKGAIWLHELQPSDAQMWASECVLVHV